MIYNREKGFLIPLTLFILLVFSILAISLLRLSTSANWSANAEMISTQAFYAAHSGADFAEYHLSSGVVSLDGMGRRCEELNDFPPKVLEVSGLKKCRIQWQCQTRSATTYELVNVALCGSGELTSRHSLRRLVIENGSP